MNTLLTVQNLYEENIKRLDLQWVAGRMGAQRNFTRRNSASNSTIVVGYFNLIRSAQAQVLGETELKYINNLTGDLLQDACQHLFEEKTIVLIIADNLSPPAAFVELANHHKIALLRSSASSYEVLTSLRYFFTQKLVERTTLHGVFLEVLSMGVLLTGESGTGKSELALELLSRGHRLIADDAPEFARTAPDIIYGSCPPSLQDFLEVRGLGVLNIRAMYGDSVIKHGKYLRLIIHLTPVSSDEALSQDRLQIEHNVRNILGVDIPIFTLPVAPGRNLAVLVEAAVRNHLLRLNGYNASEDIANRLDV